MTILGYLESQEGSLLSIFARYDLCLDSPRSRDYLHWWNFNCWNEDRLTSSIFWPYLRRNDQNWMSSFPFVMKKIASVTRNEKICKKFSAKNANKCMHNLRNLKLIAVEPRCRNGLPNTLSARVVKHRDFLQSRERMRWNRALRSVLSLGEQPQETLKITERKGGLTFPFLLSHQIWHFYIFLSSRTFWSRDGSKFSPRYASAHLMNLPSIL